MSRLGYAPGSLREGLVVDHLIRHHRRVRQRFVGTSAYESNGQGRFAPVPRELISAGTVRLPAVRMKSR